MWLTTSKVIASEKLLNQIARAIKATSSILLLLEWKKHARFLLQMSHNMWKLPMSRSRSKGNERNISIHYHHCQVEVQLQSKWKISLGVSHLRNCQRKESFCLLKPAHLKFPTTHKEFISEKNKLASGKAKEQKKVQNETLSCHNKLKKEGTHQALSFIMSVMLRWVAHCQMVAELLCQFHMVRMMSFDLSTTMNLMYVSKNGDDTKKASTNMKHPLTLTKIRIILFNWLTMWFH